MMHTTMATLRQMSLALPGPLWILIKIIAILIPLMLCVAYLTLAERKFIGYFHVRLGPNRVGPFGLLQPMADGLKLVFKEIIVPDKANKKLFLIAPALTIAPALAAWAVVPFDEQLLLAHIDLSLLYVLMLASTGVYGIIIAGWSSNSKYAFLGALRACAQMISYEIAMGFALLGVVMSAGSLNLREIVQAQSGGIFHWYCWPLAPLALIYWITTLAETNRSPFDVAEGESEIVAGFHVEYSGIAFAIFFLSEYANMILVSCLTSLLFFGGFLSPFQGLGVLERVTSGVPGFFWLFGKTAFFVFLFLWVRATVPRYRFDQIMRLGWKVLLPVALAWLGVVAILVINQIGPWY